VAKKEDASFIMAHRELRVRPARGSLQNEATINFSLLRVTIKFISGVYAKKYSNVYTVEGRSTGARVHFLENKRVFFVK
jgi:hypothetical protein